MQPIQLTFGLDNNMNNPLQEQIAIAVRQGEIKRQLLIEQAKAETEAKARERKRQEDQSKDRFKKDAVDWLNTKFLERIVSATSGGYTWLYFQDNRMVEGKTETSYCKEQVVAVKTEAEALGLRCELEVFEHAECKDYDMAHDYYETYRLKIHFA